MIDYTDVSTNGCYIGAARVQRQSLEDQVLIDLLEHDRQEAAFQKWANCWQHRDFTEQELRKMWREK